jgi:hypothetical protein
MYVFHNILSYDIMYLTIILMTNDMYDEKHVLLKLSQRL